MVCVNACHYLNQLATRILHKVAYHGKRNSKQCAVFFSCLAHVFALVWSFFVPGWWLNCLFSTACYILRFLFQGCEKSLQNKGEQTTEIYYCYCFSLSFCWSWGSATGYSFHHCWLHSKVAIYWENIAVKIHDCVAGIPSTIDNILK